MDHGLDFESRFSSCRLSWWCRCRPLIIQLLWILGQVEKIDRRLGGVLDMKHQQLF